MGALFRFTSKYVFPSNAAISQLGSINFNLSLLQCFGVPLFGAQHESKTFIMVYSGFLWIIFRIPYHYFEVYDAILCLTNFNDLVQNICMTLLHIGGSIKTILVFYRLKDVYKIIGQFKLMARKYVKSEEHKEVFANLEFENKMSLTFYTFVIAFSCTSGLIFSIIDPSTFVGKIFPYRAKMPDAVPFEVQTLYIPIAVLIIGVQIVGIDYLNVMFINLTRCQLQVLNISLDDLNEAVVGHIAVDPVQHLKVLMEHHNCILETCKDIESVFKLPMLVQFIVSLFIYAVSALQLLVRSDASGLIMIYCSVGCFLSQLLGYCWFGNVVSEQNETLSLRGYSTSWYNFDSRFKKNFLLFLMNAQRPLRFTAGGYVDLSLSTFRGILSKSYSAVAVLRRQYSVK